MAFHFHEDRKLYYDHQTFNCRDYVIPFIEEGWKLPENARVLEIGCGEGGVMKAFTNKGCQCIGVELEDQKLNIARELAAEDIASGKLQLSNKNIYDTDFEAELGTFDLIVLKDVIEHIHDQPRLMNEMKRLLKPNGHIFFGFPPWQMPFGGHQQIAPQKLLSTLPYYHLLPMGIYKAFLKAFGADKKLVDDLVEIKETGISLERFERIAKQTGYKTVNKTLFLFNPIYKYKFGLTPRKQFPLLRSIPWIRNFYTTCGFYLLTPEK